MKENRGHARCNAFGLRYINLNEALTKVANIEYDLRRLLNKASSVVPFKYGDNSITADIQNAYSHSDDYVYIASNGVPSYEITKNISGIGITMQ